MKVVLQRVTEASVHIGGKEHSGIQRGILVLCGFEAADTHEDLEWIARKILQLRIFDDAQGIMNLSVQDVQGDLLVVSQFTLHASTKKGNRPSYIKAAPPDIAVPLYEKFLNLIQEVFSGHVASGIFGADMKVSLVNDGPVTILIDSKVRE